MSESEKPPKKLYAPEIYKDKALLDRLGYGIMDVESSSGGPVGFEDVRNFAYTTDPQQNPHYYRDQLHRVTGRYYPDNLSRLLWQGILEYKLGQEQATGERLCLELAAKQYFEGPAHKFIREWCFQTDQPLPTRLNNWPEANITIVSSFVRRFVPGLRPLIEAGFNFGDILRATFRQKAAITPLFSNFQSKLFASLLARLTGHPWCSYHDAERGWLEILENQQRLENRLGKEVSIRQATLDYFQRLNLLERVEHGERV